MSVEKKKEKKRERPTSGYTRRSRGRVDNNLEPQDSSWTPRAADRSRFTAAVIQYPVPYVEVMPVRYVYKGPTATMFVLGYEQWVKFKDQSVNEP